MVSSVYSRSRYCTVCPVFGSMKLRQPKVANIREFANNRSPSIANFICSRGPISNICTAINGDFPSVSAYVPTVSIRRLGKQSRSEGFRLKKYPLRSESFPEHCLWIH